MIRELLLQLLKDELHTMPLVGKVDSVNGLTCNVSPVNGDAKILNVRLISNPDSVKYFVQIPKVGSHVIVMFLTKAVGFVVMVDEVDKIVCKVGDVVFDADAAGFLLKKENDTLKQLMEDLIEASVNAIYNTPNGPTTGMMPATVTIFNGIKTRFNNLLKSN